jgi:hypothetical protein
VRYTVPQRLDMNSLPDDKLQLFYRVRDVVKPASCEVTSGGKSLKRRRKAIMTPGEMEDIELSGEQLKEIRSDIEVSVQGVVK